MGKRVLGLMIVALMAVATTASAAYIDIAVTPAGDGVYYQNSYPGGSYRHYYADSNPNKASYSYWYSSGYGSETTKNTAYAQFNLSSAAGLSNITGISLNMNILSASKSGEDGVSAGTINHVANASGATGDASQKLGGTEFVASVMPGMSGWTSFNVTSYVLNDIANYSWAAFSFNYDGTYTDYYDRSSGFTFSSAEGQAPAYLRLTLAEDGSGGDGSNAVPEPASMMLFGLGSAGLAFVRRRK